MKVNLLVVGPTFCWFLVIMYNVDVVERSCSESSANSNSTPVFLIRVFIAFVKTRSPVRNVLSLVKALCQIKI